MKFSYLYSFKAFNENWDTFEDLPDTNVFTIEEFHQRNPDIRLVRINLDSNVANKLARRFKYNVLNDTAVTRTAKGDYLLQFESYANDQTWSEYLQVTVIQQSTQSKVMTLISQNIDELMMTTYTRISQL